MASGEHEEGLMCNAIHCCFSGNIQKSAGATCDPVSLLSLSFLRTNFCVLAFLMHLGNEKMRCCLCLLSQPVWLWLFTLFEYNRNKIISLLGVLLLNYTSIFNEGPPELCTSAMV